MNRKGQSILENVITVTLVTLGIVLSWDLSSQLIGGGVKNLVSMLEEPDPHKYIKQAPPGGGINVPGCDCSPWVEACNSASGNRCGNDLMKAKWRTCLPAGCENNVFPTLQTLICDFSDPTCCMPWQYTGICGVNATCSTPGLNLCNSVDSRCNDGTGKYIRNCQGGPEEKCDTFSGCNFLCQGSQPDNSTICPGDTTRLQNNSTSWAIPPSNACSINNNPPFYTPKCQVTCNPPYVPNGTSCQVTDPIVITQYKCFCTGNIGGYPPGNTNPRVITGLATCPPGYKVLGGWCDFVNNSNTPVGGASFLYSGHRQASVTNQNYWPCTAVWNSPATQACTSGCSTNLKLRTQAHCWPNSLSIPVSPQLYASGANSFNPPTVVGGGNCPANPYAICPGGGYARFSTINYNYFFPQQSNGSCPANPPNSASKILDLCGRGGFSGWGLSIEVRPSLTPNVCSTSGGFLWFTIQGPSYVIHMCWRNNSTYGYTNPPVCTGQSVPINAPTPPCVAPLKPFHSFMSGPGPFPDLYANTGYPNNSDRKYVICCDFQQQVP